jgi:hypothetical protein
MKPGSASVIRHLFVDSFPEPLQPGILYVSIPFASSAHLCACGCGHEVITPISPVFWELTFHGDSVSLWPSIGSWGSPCESHYWIRHNRIEWSHPMSKAQIERGRRRASRERLAHPSTSESSLQPDATRPSSAPATGLSRLRSWFRR